MRTIGVLLNGPADFAEWRNQARRLLLAEVPPEAVHWRVAGEAPGLFATGAVQDAMAANPVRAALTAPSERSATAEEATPPVYHTNRDLSERHTAGENPPTRKTSATPDGAATATARGAPTLTPAPADLSERRVAGENPPTRANGATPDSTAAALAVAGAPTASTELVDLSERRVSGENPPARATGATPDTAAVVAADAAPTLSSKAADLSEPRVTGENPPTCATGATPDASAAAAADGAPTLSSKHTDLPKLRVAGEAPPGSAADASAPTARRPLRDLSEPRLPGGTPVSSAGRAGPDGTAGAAPPTVPRAFVDLSERAIRHRDPERFALLYRVLWRLTHGEPALMRVPTDPDIVRLAAMEKAVRRDAHKMHAFVRFREIRTEDGPRFVSWFEPEHHILEAEAGFFVRRFAGMRWSILTPAASAHWDGETLTMGPGARRADAPAEDACEELWRAYYASVFNPARLKPDAMRAEMPVKYWRNLPEAREIPRLIAEAPRRAAAMVERGASAPALRRQRNVHLPAQPAAASDVTEPMPADLFTAAADPKEALAALRAEMLALNSLPPWTADATQMVFGEGPVGAPLLFVGEQPGDEEDIAGRPFVGPAGRLFNKCLEEAGIGRSETYVTNAVKHFKFKPTGRRRLHQSPDAGDISYYRPFLRREIDLVGPQLVVTLGATALRAMAGKPLAINKTRGEVIPMADGPPIFPTVHPSYLLRLPDPDSKAREYERFIADLKRAHREVA